MSIDLAAVGKRLDRFRRLVDLSCQEGDGRVSAAYLQEACGEIAALFARVRELEAENEWLKEEQSNNPSSRWLCSDCGWHHKSNDACPPYEVRSRKS